MDIFQLFKDNKLSYKNEKFKCLVNDNIIKIENLLVEFVINKNYDFEDEIINNTNKLPKLNFELNKLNEYFKKKEKDSEKNDTIKQTLEDINNYILYFIKNIDLKNFKPELIENQNLFYFLFSFMIKALFYILNDPNIFNIENTSNDFSRFFENYRIIKKYTKQCLKSIMSNNKMEIDNGKKEEIKNEDLTQIYVNSFEEIRNYKEEFKKYVENSQTFLTLILCSLKSNNIEEEEEEEEESTYNEQFYSLLKHFLKTFKTLYLINEKYNIIDQREFYNHEISKNINYKIECNTYNIILEKKYENKKPFSLISYNFLFDAFSKNEIIKYFNDKKQRDEIVNSLHNNIEGLLEFNNLLNNQSLFFVLNIRREKIIEDTLNTVSNPNINLQKPLKVKFINEQGVDEGGVRKEFFMLLVRQLFDANYGMFVYNENTRLFWFNYFSFEPKLKFELIGIILGLALFNNVILDVKFPLVIYKKLLGIKPNLNDLKEIDPELFQTFTYLQNTEDENLKDILSMNFTVTLDKFGEKIIIPLKENGENIYIDNSNKEEYINLYLDWYYNKSIKEYFEYFKTGFFRVCDIKLSKILKPEDLELIICGTQKLDFKELEIAAKYEDGYDKNSITIKYLWEILHDFNEEEKKKFLFFVTGCDRAPINGLGSLELTLSKWGPDSDKLPIAHTCFNHLLIPDYQNKEKLKKLLLIAISYSEGFGLI